ncbi:MAG: hypothetical protein BJ554DRAFT_7993 [Olpidium bornovanus]|uniref:Uncharacterized protein n=1 Tax=Olpidium bornovanus TaxID=278681 RepID=A0A8H7ZVF2_9FUNG|nr:MAG: hypothetical protein BJ554DRAFT_7993 [Olpidium bornovanus]
MKSRAKAADRLRKAGAGQIGEREGAFWPLEVGARPARSADDSSDSDYEGDAPDSGTRPARGGTAAPDGGGRPAPGAIKTLSISRMRVAAGDSQIYEEAIVSLALAGANSNVFPGNGDAFTLLDAVGSSPCPFGGCAVATDCRGRPVLPLGISRDSTTGRSIWLPVACADKKTSILSLHVAIVTLTGGPPCCVIDTREVESTTRRDAFHNRAPLAQSTFARAAGAGRVA